VKKPLADELLFGKLSEGGRVLVTLENEGEASEALAFKYNEDAKVADAPALPPAPADAG
jgi:hypothetical protein